MDEVTSLAGCIGAADPEDLVKRLRTARLAPVQVLGSGMEGTVVALEDGALAKVWHARDVAHVERLQSFYAAVGAAGLPFATPTIDRVLRVEGLVVSVQPHLVGTPLWDRPGESPPLDAVLLDAVGTVQSALAAVSATPEMAVLPVLDGEAPFASGSSYGESLAALVESRTAASAAVLRYRVGGLDRLVAAVTAALRALPDARPGLIHGDLVPGNILMDRDTVSAVIDFGFLSTVGDPAFDAAVTAGVTDMYGPLARHTEAVLDGVLGHPAERVALYRLAYALVTATCFSASGSDGHFAWCAVQLGRRDLRDDAGV